MEWAVPAPFSAGWKHNEKLGRWGWTLDSNPSLFTDIRRDQITILTLARLGWWTVEVSHLVTEVHQNLFLFETQQNRSCCKNNLPDVHDNRRRNICVCGKGSYRSRGVAANQVNAVNIVRHASLRFIPGYKGRVPRRKKKRKKSGLLPNPLGPKLNMLLGN